MVVHGGGAQVLVTMPLGMGIWRCCSGPERVDVHGAHTLVLAPLRMGIWRCCSGPERTDVHGTDGLVSLPLGMGIWRCCSGPERTDAHPMKKKILFRRVRTKKSFLRTEMFDSGGGEWMTGMKAANGYKKLTATFFNSCYVR